LVPVTSLALYEEEDDMEHSVKLASLPKKVVLPERLRERMLFDPGKGEILFRGFMTKCTYDELAALDDDADYRRALEELFVLTSEEVAPRSKSRGAVATLLVALASLGLAAAIFWTLTHQRGEAAKSVPTTAASSAR